MLVGKWKWELLTTRQVFSERKAGIANTNQELNEE